MRDNIIYVRYLYTSLSHVFSILHTGTKTLYALQIRLLFNKSLSLSLHVLSSVCLQNCEKRRTIRRTALNNTISETSLPVTEYDTSFQTLINTRLHAINDIVLEALHQHEYWRVYLFIVVNRCKFISSFTFRVSLTPLCIFYRSIRIQLHVDAALVRELPDGELSRITAYFHTPSVLVNSAQSFDFRQAITLLDNALEQFNTRGSGFVLEYVKRFVVSVLRYRPLHGSTYIPTPAFFAAKHCVINVQNRDSKCFLWSVLSTL